MKTTRQIGLASSTNVIKTVLLTTCLLFCSLSVWGQAVRVAPNGVTNFGNTIRIGGDFNNRYHSGIYINAVPTSTGSTARGIHSRIERVWFSGASDFIAVYGYAFNRNSDNSSIRHIGVLGRASNRASGLNTRQMSMGVAGLASQNNNSIGIFGGQVNLPNSLNFNTLFAGYFIGPVNVRGTLTATTFANPSDERLKRNIQSINNDAVERLFSLRPVKYHLQQIEMPADSMTVEGKVVNFTEAFFDETSVEFNAMHFGLVAQELQKVFPDLVIDRGEGFLAINYIGLIPIMLKAIQRQQQEIEELRAQRRPGLLLPEPPVVEPGLPILSFAEESLPIAPTTVDLTTTQNKLFQNVPNPFNRTTVIDYRLAENATSARISIFNLNGRQLLSFELPTTQSQDSIEVCASSLQPGMYIYALIVDGVIIDTKRMVLMD